MGEQLLADDSAIADVFSDAAKKFSLKINIKKSMDMMVGGNKLNFVLEFTYLGSTISRSG